MQAADTPIACTLSSRALHQRASWIRQVTVQSLTAHRLEGGTLRLTDRPEARTELEKIVAEEQRCCAFLKFSLRDLAEAVELEIRSPDSASADAHWPFDLFLPQAQPAAAPKACGCAPGRCG
jgi:hypothetical protein